VGVPGFVSTVDMVTEGPFAAAIERLAPFARITVFDKRGTGLSDRVDALPHLDVRMDDLRAVMDAAGIERAHLMGISEGGPMTMLFAATFPERVASLLLYGSFATFIRRDDHPWMPTEAERERSLELAEEYWGTGLVLATFLPEEERDDALEVLAQYERRSASPGAVVRLMKMNAQIDVRSVLPTLNMPTLIVHPTGDRIVPVASGRYLADHVPGARLIELSLGNHLSMRTAWVNEWINDYLELITGSRPTGVAFDRVLSTVLFSDIVESTRRAAAQGDASWKQLLDKHDAITAREVERYRGQLVKHTGDGVLARFDGPARAVSAGLAVANAVRSLGIEVRTGVHTGEIELRGDDVGGIAVHVGARVMSLAQPSEVLVTRTVRDLTAGSGLNFTDRGEHELKGVPEPWHVYAAAS
jgi:class 3 adenylate cyclase